MRSNIALILLLSGNAAADPFENSLRALRRNLFSSTSNYKPNSEEMIDHILDQGEANSKPGHKGKKTKKIETTGGVTEVQREKMKAMGEFDVHVSLDKVAEQPYEQLGEGLKGKVDQALKSAEKESKVEKKMKQAAVKKNNPKQAKSIAEKAELKHPELKEAIEKDEKHVLHERKEKQGLIHKTTPSLQEVAYNKEDEKKLVIHHCNSVREQVAFLVPTTEGQMEKAIGMLLSFDRMGHGKEGDLKFVFESDNVLNTYVSALPRLFRQWNASTANARRLLVELKENAIIYGPANMPTKARDMVLQGDKDNLRFLKGCKRLHALAVLLDQQPCDYKYAVFSTPESRFLPLKRAKATATSLLKNLPLLKAGKVTKVKVVDDKKPLDAVVKVERGERRSLLVKTDTEADGSDEDADEGATKKNKKKNNKDMNKDGTEKSAKKKQKQAKKEEAGEADFDVSKLKKKSKVATAAGDVKTEEKLKDKLNETKAAKKAIKEQEKGTGNGLVGGRLISRFDQQEKSKVMFAQNCNVTEGAQKPNPGMKAARKRMENNALVYSGNDKESPRYQRVESATRSWDFFTLQSQIPVVEMKTKASHFLLEVFRAITASPSEPITSFVALVSFIIEKVPPNKAKDFSDVLLFQYYNLVRGGYQLRDASAVIPGLPPCSDAAPLLDTTKLITDKTVMKKFSFKVNPLMVPVGFNGLGQYGPNPPLLEYDRPEFDFTDGESIY